MNRLLYFNASQDIQQRECNCPSWVRCAHFENQAVILFAREACPPQHQEHAAPDAWAVYYFPRYSAVLFETCDVCGVERGMNSGVWDDRPTRTYCGDSADDALAAFEQGEARMREGGAS